MIISLKITIFLDIYPSMFVFYCIVVGVVIMLAIGALVNEFAFYED